MRTRTMAIRIIAPNQKWWPQHPEQQHLQAPLVLHSHGFFPHIGQAFAVTSGVEGALAFTAFLAGAGFSDGVFIERRLDFYHGYNIELLSHFNTLENKQLKSSNFIEERLHFKNSHYNRPKEKSCRTLLETTVSVIARNEAIHAPNELDYISFSSECKNIVLLRARLFLFFICLYPLLHHIFILLDLIFELLETSEFIVLSYLEKWCDRDDLTVDIIRKIEKIRLKEFKRLSIHSDTIVTLSWDDPRESIGSISEVSTIAREWYICRRKADSASEGFPMDDFTTDGRIFLWHGIYFFIFSSSARRLSPDTANPCPIRSLTCSSVLQVRIPNMMGVSCLTVRSMMARADSPHT